MDAEGVYGLITDETAIEALWKVVRPYRILTCVNDGIEGEELSSTY